MSINYKKEKVICGIVLFNPDIERLKNVIESIVNQVDCVCLYDNSSNNICDIRYLINSFMDRRIVLLESSENNGIAYALNRIMEFAKDKKFEWVLTLDHDTICPNNIMNVYRSYLEYKKIGMICPNVIDKNIVKNHWNTTSLLEYEYVETCIQSGALVNILVWESVGGFDEWMFIDFVDFDYCKKLNINKYKIIRCNKTVIDHELGKRKITKFSCIFKKLYEITNIRIFKYFTYKNCFSASRIYYCTRNNIVFIKKYKKNINISKEWLEFIKRVSTRIVRGEKKIMIMRESIRGMKDGLYKTAKEYSPNESEIFRKEK